MSPLEEHCVLLPRAFFSPAPDVLSSQWLTCQGWLMRGRLSPRVCRNRHEHYVHRLPLFCFIVGCVGIKEAHVLFQSSSTGLCLLPSACSLLSLLCLEAGCTGQVQLMGSQLCRPRSGPGGARSVFLAAQLVLSGIQPVSGWEGCRVESREGDRAQSRPVLGGGALQWT